MLTDLAQQLALLPDTPGIYIYKDAEGKILYVGKAKVLKNRVRSYFQRGANLEPAKQVMVQKIASLETISTDTEHEALVLEANLIQQHSPPYNVVLRDDKYYLFIKITREEFPRVFLTRRLKKDNARYFGPYSSARAVRGTLKLLRRLFPFRGESESENDVIFPHPLFTVQENGAPHSLGEVGFMNKDQYRNNIDHIIHFLKGERQEIISVLEEGMKKASLEHRYEQAALFRDQLTSLTHLNEQQKVYLPSHDDLDVISIARDANRSAANIFSIRKGKLLNKNIFLLKHRSTATSSDILRQFILQYYQVAQDRPKTILVPEKLEDEEALLKWISTENPPSFTTAERGLRKQLLEMGQVNAQQLLDQDQTVFINSERVQKALKELATAIGHPDTYLKRIETYDISNIQGRLPTGSMVVFIDGLSAPKQYKKFHVRLQETPNDFAMMQEVLARRFAQRNTDWPTPDLIIIDGGKGQLSSAKRVMDTYQLDIPLVSLAKREEELFLPGQIESIKLPHDSEGLYLLQRMRDEAHRFTITYHRHLRSQRQKKSLLSEIPGIGPVMRRKLLNRFGSLKGIRAASQEELEKVVGKKAEVVREYLDSVND